MSVKRKEAGEQGHRNLQEGSLLPLSAARDARRLLRPIKNELVQLLQHLVQMNTVAILPDGSETEAQKVLHQFLKRLRFGR